MKNLLLILVGLTFGFGLSVSGMTDPARVQGFLDLAGRWDPTLGFVMGGGLLVNIPAYWLTRRRARPIFEQKFYLPTAKDIDARLLIGAACFGIGWGIGGFCPGPALASLSSGLPIIVCFCVAMLVGMALPDQLKKNAVQGDPLTSRAA